MTSFFQALDPTSDKSGICYREGEISIAGEELVDVTVSATIDAAIKNEDLHFLRAIWTTFNIIYGDHYHNRLLSDPESKPYKGALDFFIFPLIARKLIGDTFLEDRENDFLLNIAAWSIAIPLEIARLGASLALAIILIPVVLLVHVVDYFAQDEASARTNTM